jgi:hypothetical protein
MTEVPHDQPSDAGSGAGARPSLWQRVVTSTGQPPAWGLVRYLAGGLVAGIAFSAALPHCRATLLSALAGAIVAAAASGGPSGISRRMAVAAAGWNLVLTVVAFATGNHPVWAALAMAAVAVLTSVAGAAGPLAGVLGFLLSLSYLLGGHPLPRREPRQARFRALGRGAYRGRVPRRPARRLRRHGRAQAT